MRCFLPEDSPKRRVLKCLKTFRR